MNREKTLRRTVMFFFFPISIFYMELIVKLFCFGSILNRGFFYTLIFVIPIGLFVATLCSIFPRKVNRVLSIIILAIITLVHMIQTVYYEIFKTFTTLYSVTGVGKILQFWQDIILGILHSIILFATVCSVCVVDISIEGIIPLSRKKVVLLCS